jgi:hypothetical protein
MAQIAVDDTIKPETAASLIAQLKKGWILPRIGKRRQKANALLQVA